VAVGLVQVSSSTAFLCRLYVVSPKSMQLLGQPCRLDTYRSLGQPCRLDIPFTPGDAKQLC
jgi:hypothetical protein